MIQLHVVAVLFHDDDDDDIPTRGLRWLSSKREDGQRGKKGPKTGPPKSCGEDERKDDRSASLNRRGNVCKRGLETPAIPLTQEQEGSSARLVNFGTSRPRGWEGSEFWTTAEFGPEGVLCYRDNLKRAMWPLWTKYVGEMLLGESTVCRSDNWRTQKSKSTSCTHHASLGWKLAIERSRIDSCFGSETATKAA